MCLALWEAVTGANKTGLSNRQDTLPQSSSSAASQKDVRCPVWCGYISICRQGGEPADLSGPTRDSRIGGYSRNKELSVCPGRELPDLTHGPRSRQCARSRHINAVPILIFSYLSSCENLQATLPAPSQHTRLLGSEPRCDQNPAQPT